MVAMNREKQRGFTIIEVSLFLSLSALLLATLIFGMQRMVSQARFEDSVNSLTSFIQSQYEEARSGINPRSVGDIDAACNGAVGVASAPGTSNCLLIGKVLHFNQDSSDVRTSYAIATTVPDSSLSDQAALEASNLIEPDVGQQTYEIQWGAEFTMGRLLNPPTGLPATASEVDTIAILRSPVSSQVLVYLYKDSAQPLSQKIAGPTGAGAGVLNQQGVFVIESMEAYSLRNAGICIDAGNISTAVHSIMPIDTTNNETMVAACAR